MNTMNTKQAKPKRYTVNVTEALLKHIKAHGQFGESHSDVLERLLGIKKQSGRQEA